MKLFIVGLMLLCLCASPINSSSLHHELYVVSLKLDHVRDTLKSITGNCERYTAREQAFQDNMKNMIPFLTKDFNTLDGFKIELSKMNEHIAEIALKADLKMESSSITKQLKETEARLAGRVAKLESDNDVMANTITDKVAKQEDKIQTVFDEVKNIGARIGGIESALDVLTGNLGKIQENNKKPMVDVKAAIEEQTMMLNRVKELLEDTSKGIRELPKVSEVRTLHNETQVSLQETKHTLEDVIHRGIDGVGNKVSESKEEAKDLCVSALRLDLANSAERVIKKLNNLEKIQSVMVSMTDHVLDTRNKVENGMQQILLGVGDLMKAQGTNLNNTLMQRFDGISNDIMNNQGGCLANLTTKMAQETNQIWRQLNVMYQQMMERAKALEKLHEQNEAYVNGTTTAMGSMESKVGDITKRMREVDENLNYHLERLSFVTEEFNQIKFGLGKALDNIKASFNEIQKKANDLSTPGPPTKVDEARFSKTLPDEMVQVTSHIFNTTSN